MKFIQGEHAGLIWDAEENKPLADFKNGIFETDDEKVIAKLEKLGVDYKIPEKVTKVKPEKVAKVGE